MEIRSSFRQRKQHKEIPSQLTENVLDKMLLVVVVLEIQVFPDNSHSKGFPKFVDGSSRPHKNKKLCCPNNIIYAVVLDFTKCVYFIKHVLFSLISNTVH